MTDTHHLIEKAKQVLITNDRGGYTVPTDKLYPFQWNWDSAITALGWMQIDEPRAWQEIEMLIKGQWPNGMIPHIVFHEEVDTYFPGPGVWGVDLPVKTTSISQPPVLASIVNMMYEASTDKAIATDRALKLLPALMKYHLWWYRDRDPENTGLVVSYHPWESGMDNSPAWDKSLAAVPPATWQYQRKDTDHIDAEERPKAFEYDRFVYLVDFFRQADFDADTLYRTCPYRMFDIGIISILHKATADLIALAEAVLIPASSNSPNLSRLPADEHINTSALTSEHPSVLSSALASELMASLNELKQRYALTQQNIGKLWHAPSNTFQSQDAITQAFSHELTTGTLLPLLAGFGDKTQKQHMQHLLQTWLQLKPYGLSSTHPKSNEFEAKRYWRGPIWVHVNWLIAMGAELQGFEDEAKAIKNSAKALIEQNGYFEYFDCESGVGCGGDTFSWTAAVSLHWLLTQKAEKK